MSFVPAMPWILLDLVVIAALVLVWWTVLTGADRPEPAQRLWRRTVLVLLVALALARPVVGANAVAATATNLNVYFVVDVTPSMLAEDFDGTHPRLDGVRADIGKIAQQWPGARFSLMVFDRTTRVTVPLTTDTTALQAGVETISIQKLEDSAGSSITSPKAALEKILTTSQQKYAERGRIVFYFGDGEQTAADKPGNFTFAAGLISGGGVLGYGTTTGGKMHVGASNTTMTQYIDPDGYLLDPSTDKPAVSIYNESNLATLAQEAGLPYVHRTSLQAGVGDVLAGIDVQSFGTAEISQKSLLQTGRQFYWIPLILAALLAAWEAGLVSAGLFSVRRRAGSTP